MIRIRGHVHTCTTSLFTIMITPTTWTYVDDCLPCQYISVSVTRENVLSCGGRHVGFLSHTSRTRAWRAKLDDAARALIALFLQ